LQDELLQMKQALRAARENLHMPATATRVAGGHHGR
jgi:hypothetical protein